MAVASACRSAATSGSCQCRVRYQREVGPTHGRSPQYGQCGSFAHSPQEADDAPLPEPTKQFLEKEQAEAAPESEPPTDDCAEPENLLAHVDRLMAALPVVDLQRLPTASGPELRLSGTPEQVQRLLRGVMDSVQFASAVVTLRLDANGWTAEVTAR
jgi:hypothetical protein